MEVVAVESLGSDLGSMLDSQRELFCRQVEALQKIVVIQCRLTGVNPLSQEMAAGALSINIGKRPRDLLNPKAVKYMQSIFSIKDSIGKKESREISALCGVTVTQVREYFAGQRSGVRKSIRLSREKAAKTRESKPAGNCIMCYSSNILENSEHAPVSSRDEKIGEELPGAFLTVVKHNDGGDTNDLGPANSKSVHECSLSQKESIPDINFEDKTFLENIFSLMRKEKTFSGQTKLLEWVTQINNSEILYWFLTKGGAPILASWLNQCALEEQTSMILVIFKVLCHLPLHKALPVHLSSILQTVNKLRFYRMPDISNKARFLLSRWSKLLVRSQAVSVSLLKPNGANKELLRKQRISEILSDGTWETKVEIPEELLVLTQDSSESNRQVESGQILKLLPAPCDDSSKKNGRIVSATKTKERRKVLLVEQPDSAVSSRSALVSRAAIANKSRPLSADDIQKAKMRAFFMQQGKHGKTDAATNANCLQNIKEKRLSSAFKRKISASRLIGGELTKSMGMGSSQTVSVSLNDLKPGAMFQFSMEKLTSNQISWQKPPEMTIDVLWSLGYGGNSKEVEIQTARNRREKEENYLKADEIPENPKEPWDMEMDFDDSLTPQIPAEQFSDEDDREEAATGTNGTAGADAAIFSGNLNMDCSAEHAAMGNSMSYPSQVEHLNTGDPSVSNSMPFSLQTEHVSTISSLPFPSQGDNITVANTAIVSSSAFLSQIENVNVGYICTNDSVSFPAQVHHTSVGNSKPLESEHVSIGGNTPMSNSEHVESHAENTRMSYSSMGNPMTYPSQTLHESTRNYKSFSSHNKDLGDNSDIGNLPSRTENASSSNSMSILSKLDDVNMNRNTSRPSQSPHGKKVVGPDIELLAVLLKNPELVFALTSGQANGMTDAQTIALLDMLKKASSIQNSTSNQQTHGPNEQPETAHLPSPIPPTTAVGERMQQPDTIAAQMIVPPHQSESARELTIIHAATAQPYSYLTPNEVTLPVQMNPLPTSVPSRAFMPLPSSQSLMSYDIPIHQPPENNLVRGESPSFVPQANGGNLAVTSPAPNGYAVPYRMASKALTPSTVGYSSQASASRTSSNFRSCLPSMQPFPVNQPRLKHPASLGEPSSSRAALHEMSPVAGRTSAAMPSVTKYFDSSSIDGAAGYNKSRLSSRQSRRYDYDQFASQSLRSPSMRSYATAASSIDEYDDRDLDKEEATPTRLQHRYVEDDYRAQPRRKASGWDDHRRDSARPHYSGYNRHSPGKRRWRDRDRRH